MGMGSRKSAPALAKASFALFARRIVLPEITSEGGRITQFAAEACARARCFASCTKIRSLDEARSGAARWVNEVSPVGSYLSSSDASVHFGLGGASMLDEVQVRWPGGKTVRGAISKNAREISVDAAGKVEVIR